MAERRDIDMSCFVCTKPAQKKCARCKVLAYCSRHCQKMHWSIHKQSCTVNGFDLHSNLFTSYESFADIKLGCCLDCFDKGICTQTGYFCEACNRPRICNKCEPRFRVCQLCRR
mmetsp:Transcript_7354/g.6956  ORF Transcript_7354/g.6956 Transcript_7354/m.6956 type:complete len:114 (-) Transcript_7354:161-502(-)